MHSALAWLTLAGALLATVIAFRGGARRPVRRSSAFLLAVVVLQGVLGYTQYALGLPETLVVLHVLGSTLTWVAVCRLYFSTTRLTPPGREVSEDPADLLDRDAGRSPVGPAPGR